MKILYHHRTRSQDGQAVHIQETVKALAALGHTVVLVGPSATQNANFGGGAGIVGTLKQALPATLYEVLELSYSLRAFWRLFAVYRRERPDVLYERYSLFLLAGIWLRWLTGIPLLLEINAPLALERKRFDGLANQRLAAWSERVTWRAADRILSVTAVLAGVARAYGVEGARIEVIHNGVGIEFLTGAGDGSTIRRRFGLEHRKVLGFTGFVRSWHGLDRVIDLIAESDPGLALHLLLVGEGPALPDLKRRAHERGVDDRVTFAGLVPRHEVIDYIATFDIALQPQVVDYASPLKILEYMALGRAIVAPATSNIREILTDGETAALFDPLDAAAFRATIMCLCTDAALHRRISHGARQAITAQGLTWIDNAQRIAALSEELLVDRSVPEPNRATTRQGSQQD